MRSGQNSINKTDSPFPFPDHLSFHYILLFSSWLLVLSSSLLLNIVENGSFKKISAQLCTAIRELYNGQTDE